MAILLYISNGVFKFFEGFCSFCYKIMYIKDQRILIFIVCVGCSETMLKTNLLHFPSVHKRKDVLHICGRSLMVCQPELSCVMSAWHTHRCLPSAHHHTYVPHIRLNKQRCQSRSNHNKSAFRGAKRSQTSGLQEGQSGAANKARLCPLLPNGLILNDGGCSCSAEP